MKTTRNFKICWCLARRQAISFPVLEVRKLRWHHAARRKGKRGGIRVIYYWYVSGSLLYMLLAYSKSEQDDLTSREKRLLSTLVAEEFK